MPLYDLRYSEADYTGYYVSSGTASTPKRELTEEERRQKEIDDMERELAEREREKLRHDREMEKNRQEQDYRLALLARQCVAWVLGVGIVGITVMACVLGGIYLSK